MPSEEFLMELGERLSVLHERTVLIDAGLVTEGGNFVKGTRVEEPMSAEAVARIVQSFRTREKVIGRAR